MNEEKLSTFRDPIEAVRNEAIDALCARNAELQFQLDQVSARRAEAVEKIEEYRGKLAELREECECNRDYADGVQEERHILYDDLRALNRLMDGEELDDDVDPVDGLRESIEAWQADHLDLRREITSLSNQLATARGHLAARNLKIAAVTKRVDKAEAEADRLLKNERDVSCVIDLIRDSKYVELEVEDCGYKDHVERTYETAGQGSEMFVRCPDGGNLPLSSFLSKIVCILQADKEGAF